MLMSRDVREVKDPDDLTPTTQALDAKSKLDG